MEPFLTVLCPTYRRPRLLENAIACFLGQDYPIDRREMLIIDDAGQIPSQAGAGWKVQSEATRFNRLTTKYNEIAKRSNPQTEVFVIFEDDDVYLPHHLAAHATALETARWSKPSQVLSTYTGKPEQEQAAGRFFASIAVRRDLWFEVGGLPDTARADFDQQFLATLKKVAGPPADTLDFSPGRVPGYCFRWASTGAYHGQGHMRSPHDEEWYSRCEKTDVAETVEVLQPALDDESRMLCERYSCAQQFSVPN